MTGALLEFNAPGTGSFLGTYLDDNTSPDAVPVYSVLAGDGLVSGFNQSGKQLTGTFTASGPGCSIAPGAVGNTCSVPATIVNQFAFPDADYVISSCAVVGGAGANVVSRIDPPADGKQFTVYETALSNSAQGGGRIECSVTHH